MLSQSDFEMVSQPQWNSISMLSGPLNSSAHKGEKEMIAICSGSDEAPNKTVPSSTNAAQEPDV